MNESSECASLSARQSDTLAGRRSEYFTLGWNAAKAVLAIIAGIVVGSIAIVGFGIACRLLALSTEPEWQTILNSLGLRALHRSGVPPPLRDVLPLVFSIVRPRIGMKDMAVLSRHYPPNHQKEDIQAEDRTVVYRVA